ncbi:MAG: dTDP-4-dehydrorhamnose reductase [Deltaproteobacteria bacterium]|nr:dTDP-4-dehydrorhamnose reductase [Deltaproteobacteria bacterium]
MKILIAGAAGLVGSHLARRLAPQHKIIALKHVDLDITDRSAVRNCVADVRPDLIFNCAVIQVDEAEQYPAKAQTVNADGAGFMAEAAQRSGADIVHFSTQYAFGGEPLQRAAYTIDDKPDPVNVYGKTKVAGEAAVRAACARSFIVRTSWVYGSGKKSFLCDVHHDLRAGKKVCAIDDIWSSTTYVADLIDRVMLIRSTGRYGIYHVVNDGVCSYYEFALEAAHLLGLARAVIDPLIEITHERDMKRAAARPRYTPLRCVLSERLGLAPMRDWRAALKAYIES